MTNLAFLAMVRWFCDLLTMLTVPFTFLNPVGAVLNVTFLFCQVALYIGGESMQKTWLNLMLHFIEYETIVDKAA